MTIELSALQQQRRDTAANWTGQNPTLLNGELGYETDTGKFKIGDGSTAWTSLSYLPIPDNNGLIPIDQLLLPAGTAAAPSLTFTGDVNTGIYSPGADQFGISTAGSAALTIDSSQQVGIGTVSPKRHLHINGGNETTKIQITNQTTGSSNDGEGFQLGIATDGTANIEQRENADLVFATNNNERMRIDSSGKVGIGVVPTSPLHVKHATFNTVALFESGDTQAEITFKDNGGQAHIGAEGNALFFKTASSGTERMRIDSSGRLLVGTSTTLPVYYNAAATWDGNFQVARSDQNAVANFSIWNSTASTYTSYGGVQLHLSACKSGTVGSHTSGALASGDTIGTITFNSSDGTNFRNSARIEAVVDGGVSTGDVPGRLVFSTTADGASSPTTRLEIKSNGQTRNGSSIIADNSNGAGEHFSSGGFIGIQNLTFSSAASCFEVKTGTPTMTTRMVIRNDGDLENSNGRYTAFSDARLKENIVDANPQWDDIKSIRIRNFNFREDTGLSTHTQIGCIAQELETVCPGLVLDRAVCDEKGNPTDEIRKTVASSVLYMKAVKALQEAMERIETLEQRLNDAGIA